MILYADSSALTKRYVVETGSDRVDEWTAQAEHVACCRVGYIEVWRAVTRALLSDLGAALGRFEQDWSKMLVVEVDDSLARQAAALSTQADLRSLDALHLAAALTLPRSDLRLATWDRRLWRAARDVGVHVLPEDEP